jgi:tetratricopeptide (TPR) repeat protein
LTYLDRFSIFFIHVDHDDEESSNLSSIRSKMAERGHMNGHINDYNPHGNIPRDADSLKQNLSNVSSLDNYSRVPMSMQSDNNSFISTRTSHDSFTNAQHQELAVNNIADTPTRMNNMENPYAPSSSTRHFLTPGPIFNEQNTWANPTVKRNNYSGSLPASEMSLPGVNRNLDYSFQEGLPPDHGSMGQDYQTLIDRSRIVSPTEKVRDSPDFLSLVSQILQSSSKANEVATTATNPTPSSSSTWNHGEESISIPAIHYSKFEPVVSGSGSPQRRPESFMSRSADQAIMHPYHGQQPVYRSYGHGQQVHPQMNEDMKQHAAYLQSQQYLRMNSSGNYPLPNPVFEHRPTFQSESDPQAFPAYNPTPNVNYESSVSYPTSRRSSENFDIISGPMQSLSRSDIDPYNNYATSAEPSILPEHSISSAWSSINSITASAPYSQEFQRSQRYSNDSYEQSEYKPSYSYAEPAQPSYNNLTGSRDGLVSDVNSMTMRASSGGFSSRQSFENEYRSSYNPSSMPPPPSHHNPSYMRPENEPILQSRHSHDDYLSYRNVRPQDSMYAPSTASRSIADEAINNQGYSSNPASQAGYRASSGYRSYPDDHHGQQHQSVTSAFTVMQLSGSNNAMQSGGPTNGPMKTNLGQRSSQSISQTFLHPPSVPSTSNASSIDTSSTNANPRPTRRTTPTGPQLYRSNTGSSSSSMPPTPPSNNSPSITRSSDGPLVRGKSTSSSTDAPQMSTSPSSSLSLARPPPQSSTEFVESPRTKHMYKEFYRIFRVKERESLEAARIYATDALSWVPDKSKWKIYLELAEIAKRNNEFVEARRLYEQVTNLQPLASQGWLEWSKMEEEFGCFEQSLMILQDGLRYCQHNEGLLTKAVKQHERRDENNLARQMLSGLLHESVDRVWRSILEGALFEVRSGEFAAARKIFKFLMQHVSWYGPIYFEAFRLDEKESDYENALKIIRKGLSELPRYGPLWFGLLRIMERYDVQAEEQEWLAGNRPKLVNSRAEILSAVKNISPELIWKLYFEQAQVEERAADAAAYGLCASSTVYASSTSVYAVRHKLSNVARVSLIRSLLVCPSNLKWKVWLAGCRLELSAGRLVAARRALCLAFAHVPIKSKAYVYLEASRLEEYCGNITAARRILQIAKNEISHEWKLHLEAVLLEARAGYLFQATHIAELGLKQHSGTGRLWAVLIQLCHRLESVTSKKHCDPPAASSSAPLASDAVALVDDIDEEIHGIMVSSDANAAYKLPNKFHIFSRAVLHVPKSGEVWCEGARCVMNPMNISTFDLSLAQKYLAFAIQFTPQYGDAFIEYIRWEMLSQTLLPRILNGLNLQIKDFYERFLAHDAESDTPDLAGASTSADALESKKVFQQQYRRQLLIALEKMNLVNEEVDEDVKVIATPSELLQQYRSINIKKLNRR